MNIRDLFKRKPETKALSSDAWVAASVSAMDTYDHGRRPRHVTTLGGLGMYQGWAYVCANINARGMAGIPLRVYRDRRPDEYASKRVSTAQKARLMSVAGGITAKALDSTEYVEEVTDRDHPLVRLLNDASDHETGYSLMEAWGLSLQLPGSAFGLIVQPEGQMVQAIEFMRTPWVKIASDNDRLIKHYRYGRDSSCEVQYEPHEVIRITMPNPTGEDTLWGVSPMLAGYAWHEVSKQITEFQRGVFRNGGFPSMIASAPTLNDAQRKQIQSELDQLLKGADKAGRIIALSGDLTLTKWAMSQEELGFLQASKDMRDAIAAIFGVPTSLLTVEDVNLANGRVAAPQWQLMTVRPLCQRVEDVINAQLMPRVRAALGDPSLCVAFDNPVEEEQAERDARAVSLFTGNVATLGEARELAGLADVGSGDKFMFELVQPAGFDAIGGGFALPSASQTPVAKPLAEQVVPEGVPTDTTGESKVQELGLNGAQVTALQELLQSVSDGMQSPGVVRELILSAFPAMDPARVERMVSEAEKFGRTRTTNPEGNDARDDRDSTVVPGGGRAGGQPGRQEATDGNPGSKSGQDQVRSGLVSERLSIYLGTDHDEGGEPGFLVAKRLPNGDIEWKNDEDIRRVQRAIAKSEAEMEAILKEYFNRLFPEVVASATPNGTIGLDLGPNSDAAVVLRQMLGESASDAFMQGVEAGLAELPGLADDVVVTATDRARQFVQQNLVRLSESTLSTVKEGVELRLRQALDSTAGGDFRKVQQAVAEAVGGDSDYVSRSIARTEANRMAQEGRLTSWKESGVATHKRWITRADSKVAEPCLTIARQYNKAALDDTFVPLGTSVAGFTFNYDPRGLMAPPAKPNCRCTMIPEIE